MLHTLRLAAVVALLLVCATADSVAQTVTLSGRVLERQGGTPIAGARVAVEDGAGSTSVVSLRSVYRVPPLR